MREIWLKEVSLLVAEFYSREYVFSLLLGTRERLRIVAGLLLYLLFAAGLGCLLIGLHRNLC